jgi:hypothetical protein
MVFLPLFGLLWCLTSPSQAATFNVTNATELQAALTAAQGNGAADVIRIAQGEYVGNFTYDPVASENFDLTIEGGWKAGFTGRTLDPANTTLNGNNSGRALSLLNSNSATGNLKVEGLRMINGRVIGTAISTINSYGGGLIAVTTPPGGVTVNKNIMENNFSENVGGGLYVNKGSVITVSNNIIKNNISGPDITDCNLNLPAGGGAYLYCSIQCSVFNNLIFGNNSTDAACNAGGGGNGGGIMVLGSGEIYIVNNTITGNNAYTYGGGIYLGRGSNISHFYLYNNIIRGNTIVPYGGWLGDQDIINGIAPIPAENSLTIAYSNFEHYGFWPGPPPSVTASFLNNIDLDPQFVGGGNYNLGATSPCIDRGSNVIAGFTMPLADLQVHKRIVDGQSGRGVIVDMGAYEYGSTPYIYDLQLPLIIKNQ